VEVGDVKYGKKLLRHVASPVTRRVILAISNVTVKTRPRRKDRLGRWGEAVGECVLDLPFNRPVSLFRGGFLSTGKKRRGGG
jgi:hypothetical protein